tara:strand:+ start:537 stop:1370 length:834 start_codon:yes stop_codon:yes gene_type:complete
MKHIVTSGCSYSNTEDCVDYSTHGMDYYSYQLDNYKSWALHLDDIVPDCKVYNTAMPGAGNGYISRAVIYKVNEMLEEGKKPDYVFIQLSSCDRKELLVNIDDATSQTDKNIVTHFIPEFDIKDVRFNKNVKLKNNNMLWLKHSYEEDSMMKYWYKYYYSVEVGYLKTLEHILRLQWFFKVNDISYKFFYGWNIFSELKIPRYPIELRHLWKMIDWDNFWVHRKFGGISEWSDENLPFKDRYVTGERLNEEGFPLDEHPSNIAHREFAKQVVSKWIK